MYGAHLNKDFRVQKGFRVKPIVVVTCKERHEERHREIIKTHTKGQYWYIPTLPRFEMLNDLATNQLMLFCGVRRRLD